MTRWSGVFCVAKWPGTTNAPNDTQINDADVLGEMEIDINPAPPADNSYRIEIGKLTPSTRYVVGVRALGSGDRPDAENEKSAGGTTQPADEPDDVRNLVLDPGDGVITAMWDVATSDVTDGSPVTAYEVEIKSGSDDFAVVRTTNQGNPATSTSWDISNLKNGTEYTVRVRAYSYKVPGDWSDEEEATPTMMADGDGDGNGDGDGAGDPDPAVPTDMSAVEVMADDGMATVSWTDVKGATKYMVEWRTSAQTFGNAARQATVMAMTYEIEDLENGMEYMIRVTAGNDTGYGPPSDEVKATPMAGPHISEPTNFEVEVGDMMIMASWGKPTEGADLVKGYRLSARSAGNVVERVDVGMKYEGTLEGLTNGVEYFVVVCPYDGYDVSYSCMTEAAVTPMGVPALPIFGAVALGAGLLAAGRARLRRRELRAGRVQRQINR